MRVRLAKRPAKPRIDGAAVLAAARFFAAAAERLAARRGLEAPESVDITLHGDRASAAAHLAAMGVPGPTDVITLSYASTPLSPARGELLVNPAEAVRAAAARGSASGPALLPEERGIPWNADLELALYVAHGFDHLAGSDDATAAGFRAMRRRELRWLSALAARGRALKFFLPALVVAAAAHARAAAAPPAFYVWQRAGGPAAAAAARAAAAEDPPRELFALAGEFGWTGGKGGALSDLSPGLESAFDFGAGPARDGARADAGAALPRATAVFRVRVSALEAPEEAGAALAARARALGAERLQLDVDAPERRLGAYAALLRAVRAGLPEGAELSATLLPCHLRHAGEVREVAAAADFAVLQLHGIDPPPDIDAGWSLMSRETARYALSRARELFAGDPSRLRVSLPSYAYVLAFAPDGKFRRLFAEGFPDARAMPPGTRLRLAAPDAGLLAELFADPATPPAIWFRLPVPGADRWCLDRGTLAEIEAGRAPEPFVELSCEPLDSGEGFVLSATVRHAVLLEPFEIPLEWSNSGLSGEWIGLGGGSADSVPGVLPRSVTVFPGACGRSVPLAVVLSSDSLSVLRHPVPAE